MADECVERLFKLLSPFFKEYYSKKHPKVRRLNTYFAEKLARKHPKHRILKALLAGGLGKLCLVLQAYMKSALVKKHPKVRLLNAFLADELAKKYSKIVLLQALSMVIKQPDTTLTTRVPGNVSNLSALRENEENLKILESELEALECRDCKHKLSTAVYFQVLKVDYIMNAFKCTLCSRRSLRYDYVKRCLQFHIGIENLEYNACIDGMTSKTIEQIREYIMPYKCDECGKLFVEYEYLEREKMRQTSELNVCRFCDKSFLVQAELGRHEARHRECLTRPD